MVLFPTPHLIADTILVVEDSETTLLLICENLKRKGHAVHGVATGGQALEWLAINTPRLLLLDYQLPDMTARQLVETLSEEGHLLPFIVFTGQGDERVAVDMMKLGARDYLLKDDFFLELLPEVVGQLLNNLDNERSLKKAHTELAAQQASLKALLESFAGTAGPEFFPRAVSALNAWLGSDWALIGRLSDDRQEIRVEAMELDGRVSHRATYSLLKTPCEVVVERGFCCYPDEVLNLFPHDDELVRMEGRGYVGTTLRDRRGIPIGILVCVSRRPLMLPEQAREILEIIAGRAAAELERQHEQRRLEESEERFRVAFEANPDPASLVRLSDHTITDVNNAFCLFSGYEKKEVAGKDAATLNLWESVEERAAFLRTLNAEGEALNREARVLSRDGEVSTHLLSARVVHFGGVPHVHIIGRDISQMKLAEKALRVSERCYHDLYRQFHALLNAISNPICLLSSEFNLVWANESAASMAQLSAESLVGRPFKEVLRLPDSFCFDSPVKKSLESGGEEAGQFTDEALRRWEVRSFPVLAADETAEGVIVMLQDVTEKVNLQKKNLRAGALASLGELAAGVAHEINNPITGIIGYAEILLKRQSPGSFEEEIASGIIDEGERIASIVSSLLSFARQKGDDQKTPVQLDEIIGDTLSLSAAQLRKKGIQLNVDLEEGLPAVLVNKQQIKQVLLNLLSNAQYALQKKFGSNDKGRELFLLGRLLPGAGRVRLTVEDNGVGMSTDLLSQVCDPFFSTKPPEEGTGLGLSICHGIVAEHGSSLEIDSQEGEYTQVSFCVPSVLVEG